MQAALEQQDSQATPDPTVSLAILESQEYPVVLDTLERLDRQDRLD